MCTYIAHFHRQALFFRPKSWKCTYNTQFLNNNESSSKDKLKPKHDTHLGTNSWNASQNALSEAITVLNRRNLNLNQISDFLNTLFFSRFCTIGLINTIHNITLTTDSNCTAYQHFSTTYYYHWQYVLSSEPYYTSELICGL